MSQQTHSWPVKRLRFVTTAASKSEIRNVSEETEVSFVPMEAVGEYGEIQTDRAKSIGEVLSGYTYFREGDVIIAKITPCFENGKGAIAHGLLNNIGFGTTELHVLRPGKDLDARFLFYISRSHRFRKLGEAEMYGAGGQQRVPESFIRDFRQAIPTLAEQRTIADFLERETTKIDALVEDYRRLIELLDGEVASLVLSSMDSATTQELRLGNAATVVSRPVMQKEGELYTPIGLFNKGRGLFHKEPREMDDMGDSSFFWIEEGDLIISGQFAWEGAVVLAGKEDSGCVVSHRYHVLRGKDGTALTEYLLALLSTKHGDFLLNENSRGAAGRNRPLNITSLLKEKVPVPDPQAQEKVAKAVHGRKRLLKETSNQVRHLREYRSALISAAVTGQIEVPTHRPQEAAALCQ